MHDTIQHQIDEVEKHEFLVEATPCAGGVDARSHRERVLELYARSDLTLAQISELHQVSKSTITVWATQPAADHPFGAPLAPKETDANQPPPPSDPPTTPAAPIPSPSKIGDSDDAVTMDIKDPKTKETQEGFEI
jgi:hypothetical protein